MARLGFVDQTELLRWSDSRAAQGDLPRLIRRLILETGNGVVNLGFPGGEGIATGSWDGTVRATEPTAFIPANLSLWELSVDKSANVKADRDYVKRLTTPDGSRTEDCAYVAVSLRRWAKRLEWARAKSSDGRWKTVRAYGVDDIETWLESAPITHAWLSELLGFHPHGILSAETWWTSWSGATSPPFPAAVVLAGRSKQADELRARLDGPGQMITLEGASRDDVIAFLIAMTLASTENQGGAMLARMALVDRVEAWRRLRDHPAPLVLIPMTQEVIDDIGGGSAHHVIVPIVNGGMADIMLGPIDSQEARAALAASGLNERLSEEVGKLTRLSLLAARRRIAQKPELHRPSWATIPVPRLQRRALLVGRWDEHSTGDCAIVRLVFRSESGIGEEIAPLMSAQDPMLARFGSSIGLVSHFDAWLLLRRELGKDDLELFQSAVDIVFGEIDPALDLSHDDRWRASMLGKVPQHSADLRLGMATTLALLGSYGDMVVAGSGLTGQEWASWTVRKLLETANQDSTCRLWASLRDVLPLLAEAAPTEFLDAVRNGLHAETPLLRRMFMDGAQRNSLHSDSPHTSLLWALEVCAWSPTGYGQAVDLLARLAEVDPGGRLMNRPAACLAAIFRPWYPQTSVTAARRLASLDGLRKRHEAIAWHLMISMLPDYHGGTAMPISEPRYRDWKPEKVTVTRRECSEQVEEVCTRLLGDVETDPSRWVSLLEDLPNLAPHVRLKVLEQLEVLSEGKNLDSGARDQIWSSLRTMVARHHRFKNANWALPAGDVDLMDSLARRLQPSSPSKQFAWLFDEFMPDIPGVEHGSAEYESTLVQLLAEAATKIAASSTWPEVLSFAVSRKVPDLFGAALVQVSTPMFDREILALLRDNGWAELQFATGYLSKRFQTEGWPWIERYMQDERLSPEQVGRLLLITHDFPKAWEIADASSGDIATAFWRHFRAVGHGPGFPYVETVARRLLEVGRPGGALHVLVLYRQQDSKSERADLMAGCLEELLRCDPTVSDIGVLSNHDLVEVFSCLKGSSLSTERLARLEWAYLAIFDHDSSPLTLSRFLAQNPSLFVDAISQAYRPDPPQGEEVEAPNSEPEMEVDETQEVRRMKARQLLYGWRTLPGAREDGTVDGEFLKQWVDESRQLLRAVHRLEVGDLHIGMVLASSPPEPDGIWPCIEVRDLLENLQAAKVEDGLGQRIYYDRGVTMRGMLDGGEQELDLSTKYRKQADQLADRWPRTAAVLRGLAGDYERQARYWEETAERRRKGFET